MTTHYALTVDNKKVWTFFKEKHPSLDLENSILMFIDIMEKLSQDVNTSLNNVLAQQLVDSMKQLQSQVNVVTDNLSTMQRDTINNFTLKLAEFKKDYIDDIKNDEHYYKYVQKWLQKISIAKSKDWLEAGMPHTLDTTIIMDAKWFKNPIKVRVRDPNNNFVEYTHYKRIQ